MQGLRYRLALTVHADSTDFEGTVVLSADGLPAELTLDSVGHAVRSIRAGSTAVAYRRTPDAAHLTIGPIPAGTTELTIDYSGTIDDPGLSGFYVSPYGPGRIYTTYFEPAGARRLLPCLDRPDAKAVFEVEVTGPRDAVILSNTEAVASEERPDGARRVRFAPTPPMATYVLYVGVGPFEERAGAAVHPRVIVATPPGRSGAAGFALAQGERAVDYFARYYDVEYPLPKLHLIAVPQFGTGAMENWGAIVFQEHLIVHDAPASLAAQQRAVEVICHEIAHQWFGNLVTMAWWTDLWLNESFASFVAVQAAEALFPGWSAWDDFLVERTAAAMVWDALPHTHPIRTEVSDPLEVRQIFDEISYGKGASVLRMAEADVGADAFRRGVSRYLRAHREGNAEADDLWAAVAASAGRPTDRIYGEWVSRPGVPVVSVRRDGDALRLEQHRFSTLGGADDPPWPIPLAVRSSTGEHRRLFAERAGSLAGVGRTPIVNPGRTGYFRVEYDAALMAELLDEFDRLPAIDRWAILNDERAFLFAGRRTLAEYLRVFDRLTTERDPFVIEEGIDVARGLYPVVARLPAWAASVGRFLRAQSERLGVEGPPGETDRDRRLREYVTLLRVRSDPAFARTMAPRYAEWPRLEPELRPAVAGAFALGAGPAEAERLRADLAAATSAQAKGTLAGAVGLLPRGEWVVAALGQLLTGELFLGPWMSMFGTAMSQNPAAAAEVYRFLAGRIDDIVRTTARTSAQGVILQYAIPLLGLGRGEEVRAWAARSRFPESARAVTKGLDLLAVYERLLARERADGDAPTTPK